MESTGIYGYSGVSGSGGLSGSLTTHVLSFYGDRNLRGDADRGLETPDIKGRRRSTGIGAFRVHIPHRDTHPLLVVYKLLSIILSNT